MPEKHINRFIGGAVLVVIAYYIIQMILPFLIIGIIGLVFWRIYQDFRRS
jgi:hypothetical protein